MSSIDQITLADLIANYGTSSSTAWLERERYQLWQPAQPVPESSFVPIQGYMERDPYIFAWGDPLVSSSSALPNVVRQFASFVQSKGKRPVWLCIDRELADVIAEELGWTGLSCVNEDEVDPSHIMMLTSPLAKGKEGQHAVKDLKKNLAKADKAGVEISEVRADEWTAEEKVQVEHGITKWKAGKHGVQIASTSFQPWLDFDHRRYWVARVHEEIVGILFLTPVKSGSWQIKNCASFPSAPKGTSEALIYAMLKNIDREWSGESGSPIVKAGDFMTASPPHSPSSASSGSSDSLDQPRSHPKRVSTISDSSDTSRRSSYEDEHHSPSPSSASDEFPSDLAPALDALTIRPPRSITFGASAASKLQPLHHLHGWKVKALMSTYSKVVAATGIIRRGEFRHKFDARHVPLFVSYPADGFGIEGVNALLKVLRK